MPGYTDEGRHWREERGGYNEEWYVVLRVRRYSHVTGSIIGGEGEECAAV